MANTRGKTSYLAQVSLRQFLQKHTRCVLATFTFRENVTSKREAMRRWKPIADLLRREKIDHVGVWQQQKRGAWHYHALINAFMEIHALRAFAVARGWGPFLNLELVGAGSRNFSNPERVISYLTRYLSRAMCSHVPKLVRLLSATRAAKCGTVRFQWVDGFAKAWRVGCDLFVCVKGRIPITKRERETAMDYGVHELGLLDFLTVTVDGPNPYG